MKNTAKNQYPPNLARSKPPEPPFFLIEPKSVHFIGVLGIGVSSLAQWFLAQNWAVSGSDTSINAIYPELKKVGLRAKIGQKKANVPAKCGLVVYSQAVKPDNPELKEARSRDIPMLSYPEAVGELTDFYKTFCVSGMHGKSTTASMAGLMLVKAGFDPNIIVGTRLKELGGRNFRAGKDGCLVLEADEYKDAFLNYSPLSVIATNLDAEHLDYFKNSDNIKKSFLEFFLQTRGGGSLILNRDNKMLGSLRLQIDEIRKKKKLKVNWYSLKNKNAVKIRKVINLPGEHNVSNALAVFELGKILGISEKKILASISEYKGSWRRMEYRGKLQIANSEWRSAKGHKPLAISHALVYDDYAHHPTEIKATLAAFREKFPKSEIICVFQPHQAERLKLLFKEFKTAFDNADKTIIMPVYKVAGRENKESEKYDSESLVRSIQKLKPPRKVFYLKEPKNIKKALEVLLSNRSFPCPRRQACPLEKTGLKPKSASNQRVFLHQHKSAVIIMMGAGDIYNLTNKLVR